MTSRGNILAKNRIQSLQSDVFSHLESIRHIQLRQNQIKSISGDAFRNLKGLRNVNLSRNKITAIPKEWFEGLTGLKYLYFQDNPLVCSCALYETLKDIERSMLRYGHISAGKCDGTRSLFTVFYVPEEKERKEFCP